MSNCTSTLQHPPAFFLGSSPYSHGSAELHQAAQSASARARYWFLPAYQGCISISAQNYGKARSATVGPLIVVRLLVLPSCRYEPGQAILLASLPHPPIHTCAIY
ncbi:unnamed protein product [Tilletia laevis]|uniref:Uncharacterized protein n=2 Tax=Tilletia TaxID=13289 RepID=A0A9N8M892_9BASI|nr:unnamed protein product [Tilletia caries]CAD6949967.1 unnamed protein product [Tilletia caries]CAD6964433.1 unnamed protein product [Tilletia laevis]